VLQRVALTNEFNILRLTCGLFCIPHIYAKFFVPEALGFFVAAKFRPPAFWMYTACVIETVLAIGLIFNIYTMYVAAIACVHLLVAGAAVWKVTGGKWLWNIGGYENCVFLGVSCLGVAGDAVHWWLADARPGGGGVWGGGDDDSSPCLGWLGWGDERCDR